MPSKTLGNLHQTGGVESILSHLFQKMLLDRSVNTHLFEYLLLRYLNDPLNKIPENVRDRSIERGKFKKQLLDKTMTWKIFCQGMILLGVEKWSLHVEIYRDDSSTGHTIELPPPRQCDGRYLAVFFQQILKELEIAPKQLKALVTEWVRTYETDRKAVTTIAQSVRRELASRSMTWKVFCKGLFVIQSSHINLTVKLIVNHLESTHSVRISTPRSIPSLQTGRLL